jgi:arylsulfatase A-like enzyme
MKMRLHGLYLIMSALALTGCHSQMAEESPEARSTTQDKPNIVFILSDDQGWTDYGFMGHRDIQTPHLDQLAKESLLFRRGYVATPVCRPSLASMVTGLFPFDHYVTGNDVSSTRTNREAEDRPLRELFYQHPGFIRMLSDHGYLTHQSGKWWEGSYEDGGFTHGMKEAGRHGSKESLAIGREGLKPIEEFIDLALEENKPFFVWYGVFLPHTPHNPPEKILAKYQKEGRAEDVAKYYAMCDWFDQTCGELLALLDQRDIREDTLIIYICDNGWVPGSIHPLPHFKYARRSKTSPYEYGIRTPIMLSWPGTIEPADDPNFAHAIDLFPTIAAVTGIDAPDTLPGINLLDKSARANRKAIFGTCYSTHNMTVGDPHDNLQYLWCIEGDWKCLVRYHGKDTTRYKVTHEWDTAPVRLFNLANDPHEQNDLSGQHPEIVQRLQKKINTWYPGPE